MNLFTKLFRSMDKPKDYLSVHWPFLFGGTNAGRNVNERTSMDSIANGQTISAQELRAELKRLIPCYVPG